MRETLVRHFFCGHYAGMQIAVQTTVNDTDDNYMFVGHLILHINYSKVHLYPRLAKVVEIVLYKIF